MPGIRTSEGRYLEILEATPAVDVPIEVDIYDGGDPATMLATLEGAYAKTFERRLSEIGSGSFRLNRLDSKAGTLVAGNIAKFRVGGAYRHAVQIEEPETIKLSKDENAGQAIKVAGRGILAYTERAGVYPPVWPPAAAVFRSASSADNGAGATSLTVPKPLGTLSGDVVLVSIVTTSRTPAAPPGWKRIRNTTNGALRLVLFRRPIAAGEPASWTFTFTASTVATGGAIAFTNVSSDDTSWAIGDSTGSGTSTESPSVSIPLVDGELVSIVAKAASTSVAPPAGMTERIDRAATGRTLEVATLDGPALGDTGDLTSTSASSADWIGVSIFLPSIATVEATFEGATFGTVLSTLIDNAKARGAIPALTYDFGSAVDSHGEPWADVHDLAFHIGTSLLEVIRHLVTLGLEVEMTPSFRLRAFVDSSRHFETSVIFRAGYHVTGEIKTTVHQSSLRTRYLVEGAGGRVAEVTDPVLEADPRIGRREGHLSMTTSDNATTLQRAGEIALREDQLADQARSVDVDHGPAAAGRYEPWVDYREGDWIGLDADANGTTEAQRVVSITLAETAAGGYGVNLDLNSVALEALLRLQRRLDALSSSGTGSGTVAGSSGSSGAGSGKVAVSAVDQAGYLFDKVDVEGGVTKAIAGEAGSQRVRLGFSGASAHPDLATHDALGLATDAELAAHAGAADPHAAYALDTDLTTHAGAADPHAGYQRESERGAASGYAPLDSGILVPVAYLPVGTGAGQVAAGNHAHVNDHARQHSATSATDHTFPGGTTDFLRADGSFAAPAGGGSALTVADEGTPLATAATTLDFVGAGVVASGAGATKTITISGGGSGVTVEEVDGTPTVTATKLVLPNGTLGVVGTVATYTPAGGGGSTIEVEDPFGTVTTGVTRILFARQLVTALGGGVVSIGALVAAADLAALGTYGDECNTVTLDAAWTLRNISGVTGDGSAYPILLDAQGDAMTRAITDPAADFEIMAHLIDLTDAGGMIGLCALDSSNNGRGYSRYNDGNTYQWTLAAFNYSGTGPSNGGVPNVGDHWLHLRRVSNNWAGRYSSDGETWSGWTANVADSRTITKIGVVRAYTSGGTQTLKLARFVYGTPSISL